VTSVMLDHLALLEDAVPEVAAVLAEADPAAVVPACPGWTVRDLAGHLVAGHRWAASIVLSGRKQLEPDRIVRPAALAPWFEASGTALVAALRAVDPDEPCWNFAHVDERAGFWRRRRLHELVVHGADARQAAGLPLVLDPELAADGVDEVFGVFLPRMLRRGAAPAVTVPVAVAVTDTGDVWTLSPGDDPATVPPRVERATGEPVAVHEPGEVACVVRGTAADLYLALWKRVPADRVRIDGNSAAGRAFLAAPLTP
jgi:uncharacterized protein (TIGR03083 family)